MMMCEGGNADRLPRETTVLIVGGGPVGLTASLLLARHGIRSLIVERHKSRLPQPKAHAINPRSAEILRQMGFDVEGLRRNAAPVAESKSVNFVTTFSGLLLSKIPYERQDAEVRELTPEPLFNVPQSILESALEGAAMKHELIQICRSCKWNTWQIDHEDRVQSSIIHRDEKKSHIVASKFVIGADGTNSTVRSTLPNVQWSGLSGQDSEKIRFVSICCRGDLSTLAFELDRPGQLYFSCLPTVTSALIAHNLSNNWVLIRRVEGEPGLSDNFDEARSRALVDEFVGTKLDYEILSVNQWFTEPRIASSYSSADGRVLLAGDAAHSFPPTGGLGLNTGIADVHNLCWKLVWAVQCERMDVPRLIGSYTEERRSVALANARQSWQNSLVWFESMEKLSADLEPNLSTTEIENRWRDAAFLKSAKLILDANRPHFDSLGLQIGYAYGSEDCFVQLQKDCSTYTASIQPGARLPHFWLPDGSSSLDLVEDTKFTLLVRKEYESKTLKSLTESTELPFDVEMKVAEGSKPGQDLESLGLKINEGLLVRPDQHIVGVVRCIEDVIHSIAGLL